jgi:capsular exopolysaccharide synthesis family protein
MNEARKLSLVGGGYVAVPEEAIEYVYHDADAGSGEKGLDLRALWAALYRNRFLIVGIVVACMGAALGKALLTAPVYQATTSIQIDQQAAKVLQSQDQDPDVSSTEADRFLQTQVDVIKSRTLATRVADSLGLAADKSFAPAKKGSPAGAGDRREHVVDVLTRNLSVDLPRNSRVVKIQYEDGDPARAARITNSFAENMITSNLQRRFDTSAYSRQFLEGQLAKTKAKLEESERAVVAYARSAGLIDASSGMASAGTGAAPTTPQSITTSSLVQINQAYSQAHAGRVEAEQKWRTAQGTPALNLPEVLSNPTIQQLTQHRAELQAELTEEQQRRKEGHPAIIQAEAKLAEVDRQIGTIANSIKNSIHEQYDVAVRQERGLQGSVGQLKGATLSEQDRSVRYNILKREADTNRELYDGLLQRYRELSAAAGITSNNISIIDRADPPRIPVWPRPLLNLAIGFLAGLFLALIAVFLREKFDDAIRSAEDVERKLNLSLLGTVPLLRKEAPIDALENPRSLLSEAHYALRMSLELASDQGLPPSILLTSSRQAEGKSTSAYAIARDLALAGKRVLLVDADLRKPSLHRLLGLENRYGLANLLARQRSFEDVIQTTAVEELYFISSGPLPPNPAQLLAGATLGEVVGKLKQVFDVVIFDGPPVLGLADAPRLADVVDGTIFVVEANGAHHGHAKSALKRLLAGRGKLLGVILTKFDARKAGYKSDYGYYYYEYGNATTPQLEPAAAA